MKKASPPTAVLIGLHGLWRWNAATTTRVGYVCNIRTVISGIVLGGICAGSSALDLHQGGASATGSPGEVAHIDGWQSLDVVNIFPYETCEECGQSNLEMNDWMGWCAY